MTENTASEWELFAILVEDEIADILNVPTAYSMYSNMINNASLLDITELPYRPSEGHVWDGENFLAPENFVDSSVTLPEKPGFKYFAFLSDNICVGRTIVNPTTNPRLAAAFSSNPTFLPVKSFSDSLEDPSILLGQFVRNGQLVSE
jgi:hypothetical protein